MKRRAQTAGFAHARTLAVLTILGVILGVPLYFLKDKKPAATAAAKASAPASAPKSAVTGSPITGGGATDPDRLATTAAWGAPPQPGWVRAQCVLASTGPVSAPAEPAAASPEGAVSAASPVSAASIAASTASPVAPAPGSAASPAAVPAAPPPPSPGDEALCNPTAGDTSCRTALPLLCFRSGTTPALGQTQPVAGFVLASAQAADARCAAELGAGWVQARFPSSTTYRQDGERHGSVRLGGQRLWLQVEGARSHCWDAP